MATDFMKEQQAAYWAALFALEDHDAAHAVLEHKRDAIQDAADAQIAPINLEIEKMIADRVLLQERQGFLARGCGNKVGERPERAGS